MLTRALIDGGSTSSLYACVCSLNHSKHGTLTTRVEIPDASKACALVTAKATSEPVAIKITWAVELASLRI